MILEQFAFRYTDDDQTIMWYGAEEMSHGRFHEPCFYGQRYNTMLEGALAVPLLWLGIAHSVALPLTTSALALFPFLLIGALLVRRQRYGPAVVVLVLPILLPPEYGMVTSIPRGFVTGIFVAAFALLPLFSKRAIPHVLAAFCGVLALWFNLNAALVLVPAGVLILLEYGLRWRLLVLWSVGAAPAIATHVLATRYYDVHPHHEVHFPWPLSFDVDRLTWQTINSYLDQMTPLLWGKGPFVFLLLCLLVWWFIRDHQWKPALALLVGTLFLLATFGVNKVHDGMSSVFFSWSRMFIGVPVLLAVFLSRSRLAGAWQVTPLAGMLALGFFLFKSQVLPHAVAIQVSPTKERNLYVEEVSIVEQRCARIAEAAKRYDVGLVVVGYDAAKHLTAYGCPCLHPDLPETIEPEIDRRTWKLQTLAPQRYENVMFASYGAPLHAGLGSTLPPMEQVSMDPMLFLLKGNVLPVDALLDSLHIGMRPH